MVYDSEVECTRRKKEKKGRVFAVFVFLIFLRMPLRKLQIRGAVLFLVLFSADVLKRLVLMEHGDGFSGCYKNRMLVGNGYIMGVGHFP